MLNPNLRNHTHASKAVRLKRQTSYNVYDKSSTASVRAGSPRVQMLRDHCTVPGEGGCRCGGARLDFGSLAMFLIRTDGGHQRM